MTKDLNLLKDEIQNVIQTAQIEELTFIEDDKIEVKLLLSESDNQSEIKDTVISLLKIKHAIPKVKYSFEILKEKILLSEAKKIIVSSGKGGVGKSSVTANIANIMSKMGLKVAVIDADIYGSSIPMIFDLEISPESAGNKIKPIKFNNIELIGTSNVNPDNEPIVWRGPMLGRLINSFFNDVAWSSEIEYLLIDLPPGTGDVPLDLNGIIPDAKSLVVTTPSKNASKVAIKAGEIAKIQNHELIGVIENMSYYDHNGERLTIFGEGGGQLVAEAVDTPLIGQIPIFSENDSSLCSPGSVQEDVYQNIVGKIISSF